MENSMAVMTAEQMAAWLVEMKAERMAGMREMIKAVMKAVMKVAWRVYLSVLTRADEKVAMMEMKLAERMVVRLAAGWVVVRAELLVPSMVKLMVDE